MFKAKVTVQVSDANSCLYGYLKATKANLEKNVPCKSWNVFSGVNVITSSQLPGVRGLRGHLLHIVTFLVLTLNFVLVIPVAFFQHRFLTNDWLTANSEKILYFDKSC